MAAEEKITLEEKVGGRIQILRQREDYPRMMTLAAGLYHGILAFFFIVGSLNLIINRPAIAAEVMREGRGEVLQHEANALGDAVALIGGVTLFFGGLHTLVALGLLAGERWTYASAIVLNLFWLVIIVISGAPNGISDWLQIVFSGVIVIVWLFDARLKAIYGRGRYAVDVWEREEARRLGRPFPPKREA